ncbi:MAG: hypothetical protein D6814_03630, partial [Calditrichaeota bacterium]
MRSLTFIRLGLVAVLTAIVLPQPSQSQVNAGRGLTHVRSAWNLDPGYLIMYGHTRVFGKVGKINLAQSIGTAVTFWDVQGSLAFSYGISEHFELGVTPIIYQDTQRGRKGYNLIDDIFLTLKVGSLGRRGGSVKYGFDISARFPSAKRHNIIFEPYSAGKVSFGFNTRLSYSKDPLYPDDATSLHFNLGYWNHNDVGEQLTDISPLVDTVRVLQPTQELLYGAGIILPSDKFDFSFELYGNAFLQRPPETAYSRENVLYFAPKVRYKPYRWLSLDMALDLRLTGGNDQTNYGLPGVGKIPQMPNYADWRINLGSRFTLLPTTVYSLTERDILMRKAETRRELFEKIIREQRETEAAEEELQRIKEA